MTVLLHSFVNPNTWNKKVDIPLSVFCVSNRITDDILKENLEDTTGFFVDETGDTFDTTTTS